MNKTPKLQGEKKPSRPITLWEINVTAYKTFYVKARSQEQALCSAPVEDEQRVSGIGDFDWEHDETTARKVETEQAKWISKQHPELIAK